MLIAHLSADVPAIAGVARIVVLADFVFTATAVGVQPVTGVWLVYEGGYSLKDGWIVLSIALYILTGVFWLPVVWMQMQMRNLAVEAVNAGAALPQRYHRLFWTWFLFGFPAFASVLGIIWLMITRPEIKLWPA